MSIAGLWLFPKLLIFASDTALVPSSQDTGPQFISSHPFIYTCSSHKTNKTKNFFLQKRRQRQSAGEVAPLYQPLFAVVPLGPHTTSSRMLLILSAEVQMEAADEGRSIQECVCVWSSGGIAV